MVYEEARVLALMACRDGWTFASNAVTTQTAGEVRDDYSRSDESIDHESLQCCARCGHEVGARREFEERGWACTQCQLGTLCAACAYKHAEESQTNYVRCPACLGRTSLFKCMGCSVPCTLQDRMYKRFPFYEEGVLRDALRRKSDFALDEAFWFLQQYCAKKRRKTSADREGLDEMSAIFSEVLGDASLTRVQKLELVSRRLAPFFWWIFNAAVYCGSCKESLDTVECPGCGFWHALSLSVGGKCMHCAGQFVCPV